jgi:hypothetical protein
MATTDKEAAANASPDWSSLPTGVLQHVLCLASTWQAPGCCLGARVCRSWRTAADGCSAIRLLYLSHGVPGRDELFAAWLGRNSGQLDSLIISSSARPKSCMVLYALAAAATAAAAAKRPLRLRTLRVLGGCIDVKVTGQLLAALPRLRTLQLSGISFRNGMKCDEIAAQVKSHWGPLQQATQLQELYMEWPCCHHTLTGDTCACGPTMAQLLPTSLQRLAWEAQEGDGKHTVPNLAHLGRLAFLQLAKWDGTDLSSQLPPGLQQLQLESMSMDTHDLREVRGLVTSFIEPKPDSQSWPRVARFHKAQSAVVTAESLRSDPAIATTLAGLRDLSTLTTNAATYDDMKALLSTAAHLRGLSCLTIKLRNLPLPQDLGVLTGVTRLTITHSDLRGVPQQQHAWTHELGRLGRLRWLSVPGELLLVQRPWLNGLQQLQALLLSSLLVPSREYDTNVMGELAFFLGLGIHVVLPPRLRLLGFTGITVGDAAAVGLPHRLQQVLGGTGCEVVAGPSLEVVCDPTQQLAGLPDALQQALA